MNILRTKLLAYQAKKNQNTQSMKFRLFVLFYFSFIISSYCQDGSYNFGARNSGIGNASVTISDPYSIFNNIGALGRLDNHYVFAGYQSRYNISDFQIIGAGGIYHHPKYGNAGIGFYRSGGEDFSKQRINLAIGHTIQLVSLGLGVDLIQYRTSTLGSKQTVAIQFGGVAEIIPQLRFGAHIFNISQSKLSNLKDDLIPTTMKAGISYLPIEELMVNVEVEKEINQKEIIRAGVEFQIIERVFIRTGIITRPFSGAFGIGFYPKNFKIDYAFSNQSTLGNVHELSVAYRLNFDK